MAEDASPPASHSGRLFRSTHWSVVAQAAGLGDGGKTQALETFCRTYWYPLYAHVRRRGYGEDEAKDLTQGFFARMLEKNYLGEADRARGRFRTFLLSALNNYLANEWDRATAAKRGGNRAIVSFDGLDPEERYRLEPLDERTPESLFDRHWAEALLASVLIRLRAEFEGGPRSVAFDALKPFLVGDDGVSYADLAATLGVAETGARSAVHRLRRRYRDLMREAIADTVSGPAEIEDEIRHLVSCLGR